MLSFIALKLSVCLIACAAVQDDSYELDWELNRISLQNAVHVESYRHPAFVHPIATHARCRSAGVCGQNQCWDCSGEEGIDVSSLTPRLVEETTTKLQWPELS